MTSDVLAGATKSMALAFYAQARGLQVPEQAPLGSRYPFIALVMAAVWIACEQRAGMRYKHGSVPTMSRDDFVQMARAIYDCCQTYQP